MDLYNNAEKELSKFNLFGLFKDEYVENAAELFKISVRKY